MRRFFVFMDLQPFVLDAMSEQKFWCGSRSRIAAANAATVSRTEAAETIAGQELGLLPFLPSFSTLTVASPFPTLVRARNFESTEKVWIEGRFRSRVIGPAQETVSLFLPGV
jgi:hypothetical protein